MYVILWPKGELFFNEKGNLFHICGRIHEKKYGMYSFVQWVTCSVSVKWTHAVLFYYYFYYYYYNNNHFRLFANYVALQDTLHTQECVKKIKLILKIKLN